VSKFTVDVLAFSLMVTYRFFEEVFRHVHSERGAFASMCAHAERKHEVYLRLL
jgi:hypothetical protein